MIQVPVYRIVGSAENGYTRKFSIVNESNTLPEDRSIKQALFRAPILKEIPFING